MDNRLLHLTSIAVFLSLPSSALALPDRQTASGTVDDALVELTLLAPTVEGDSRSRCSVRIDVGGADVAFTAGDTVALWVYEDDAFGNDEIWTTSFTVTAAEVGAQAVDRTLDCTGSLGTDGSGSLQIFA